jgi:hypothetical protein
VLEPGTLQLGALPFMRGGRIAADASAPELAGALAEAIEAARQSSDVDFLDPGPTRLRWPKRMVLRVMRPVASRQAAHNRAVDRALEALQATVAASGSEPPRP